MKINSYDDLVIFAINNDLLVDILFNPQTNLFVVNIDGGLWEREATHQTFHGAAELAVNSAIEKLQSSGTQSRVPLND